MLLTIREEKEAIAREVKAIEQVGAQVSSQMCRFREFKQFKVIIGLIQKHLKELEAIQNYDCKSLRQFRVEPYMQASQRIKNHLVKKSRQVKQLINDSTFGAYATLARNSLAKINYSLGEVQAKMLEAVRVIEHVQGNFADEALTN